MNHKLIAEYLKQIDLAENEHRPWCRSDYADGLVDILRDIFTDDELIELAQAKAEGRLVERGTWINGYCSNCNSPIPTDNKDDYIAKNECRFCYYCGAKMEEAAEKVLPACNVTKLPCAGCNPVCEHREG